jgi:uncharacterized protein (TIGR02611 family)
MVAWTLRKAKRLIIAVTGFTVLAIGIAMIVLPGPAIIVIPIGLGILAIEFVWAKTLLKHAKERIARVRAHMASRRR